MKNKAWSEQQKLELNNRLLLGQDKAQARRLINGLTRGTLPVAFVEEMTESMREILVECHTVREKLLTLLKDADEDSWALNLIDDRIFTIAAALLKLNQAITDAKALGMIEEPET